MSKLFLFLLFLLFSLSLSLSTSPLTEPKECRGLKVYDVVDYGAKGDGTDDTKSIQKAIDDAIKNKSGCVFFEEGKEFHSFPIRIVGKNIVFALGNNAVLKAIPDLKKWPKNGDRYFDFLKIENSSNITVIGGEINGQGEIWWEKLGKTGDRPRLVAVLASEHLLVSDMYLKNSPFKNLELHCNYTEVRNTTVYAPFHTNNTDGLDLHYNYHHVHNCSFSCGDDNIAIHGSHILIEDSHFGTGHGISIGSISDEHVHNVTFTRLTFKDTIRGARIKTSEYGAGIVENVTYSNFVGEGVVNMVAVEMFYKSKSADQSDDDKPLPVIRNITYRNITNTHGNPGYFKCNKDSPCTGISLDHIAVHDYSQDWICQYVHGTETDTSPKSCLSK